jgi:glycosyltransferase involved in cell wall biosynthesis
MKKICVLLDGPVANDGRVRRVIHSLSEDQVDLYYFCGSDEDSKLFNENVTLIHCQLHKSWIKTNLLFHLKFGDILEKISNKQDYDLIYCNDYPLLNTAVQIKRQNPDSKLIYDSHEIYCELFNQFFPTIGYRALYGFSLIWINKIIHKAIERKNIKKVDYFTTVCDSLKVYFENRFHRSDVIVVRNCPDISNYPLPQKNNQIRGLLHLPDDHFIVLYQGMINKGRGLENCISAFKHLSKNIHLVIIGSGPIKQDLETNVRAQQIENVHFLGKFPFEKLLEYTASADLGLLLIEPINISKRLSLPNKVFEYMYAGIPFLSNNLPEASSILSEVNCGFILSSEEPKELASKILQISENKSVLHGLGENGFHAVKSKYNWENEVEKIKKLVI